MNENKTIAIIDDDEDFLFQSSIWFERKGYWVRTFNSMNAALSSLDTLTVNCVIVDLMMERVDAGFVLCHRIKEKYPQVPIIMVTSSIAEKTGLSYGVVGSEEKKWLKADVVLAKPLRFEQMQVHLDKLLKN